MRKGTERGCAPWIAALVVLSAACGGDVTTAPGADRLGAAELEQLALEDEAFLASFMGESFTAEPAAAPSGDLLLSVEPIVTRGEFSWTRNCPGGGEVKVEGSFTREVDREAGTAAVRVAGEKRKESCVHLRGDVRITVDAEARFEANRQWEDRRLLAASKSVSGEFSYETSDGREGRCEFELHAEWDPVERRVHVTGNYCGREIDRFIQRGGETDE